MQRLPQDELRDGLSLLKSRDGIDNQTALRLKKRLAEEFREQLMVGVPTNADEAGLRRLANQLRDKKVVVKFVLRHPLHAKLYLLFRPDPVSPSVGFLGSSNLTFAGLSKQGELNIDVVDHDACKKLADWFEARWEDQWCIDISKELLDIIEESWARDRLLSPYHIYLKMAYHLSQEARHTVNRVSEETASRILRETLPQGDRPLQLLTTGDRLRSVHGVTYRRLWNADLLATVREAAGDYGPPQTAFNEATGLYCGEQDLFAFLIDPTGWIEIGDEQFAPASSFGTAKSGSGHLGFARLM